MSTLLTAPEREGKWEQLWLPLWPLASDDLVKGVYRCSRDEALQQRYIEANPHALSNLLIVDVDHSDSVLRCLWNRRGWEPTVMVENPLNGHAHAVWALKEPVTRTEYARRKPLALAAAVAEGLRRAVDGDAGYSGLITKNPLHAAWEPWWQYSDRLYDLNELAEHLQESGDLPKRGWRKRRDYKPAGLGRNCTLFDTARVWAYREVRYHWGDPLGLAAAIEAKAHELNAEFDEPLPHNEVHHIAKSISRWITTKSRIWKDGAVVYDANFITIQSARGRKGGIKSGEKRREKAVKRYE